jgi:hypothetical protein
VFVCDDLPSSAHCAIHDTVIAAQGDLHDLDLLKSFAGGVVVDSEFFLGAADGQDAGLGRVDDSGEVADGAEHAKIGDGEGAPLVFVWR